MCNKARLGVGQEVIWVESKGTGLEELRDARFLKSIDLDLYFGEIYEPGSGVAMTSSHDGCYPPGQLTRAAFLPIASSSLGAFLYSMFSLCMHVHPCCTDIGGLAHYSCL